MIVIFSVYYNFMHIFIFEFLRFTQFFLAFCFKYIKSNPLNIFIPIEFNITLLFQGNNR